MNSYNMMLGSTEMQPQKVKVVGGYALQQRLGSGSFAVVYKGVRVTHSSDTSDLPDTIACKAIARTSEKLTKKVLQNLEIEISILRTYRHRNIVCMHNVVKTDRHFYLMLEYCAGGDVQGLMRSRQKGRLSEILARRLMRDLSAGLKFLWGQELIHRDIKPQNLLLTGPLPADEVDDPPKSQNVAGQPEQQGDKCTDFALKIADFGFARHLQTASLAETLCGSPIYMAPEILQHQRYDAKADLWSVGTVLFEMICGRPPFHGENHIDLLRNIQRKAVRLPADVRVSKECVNLLRLLLNRNPLSRAGFKEFFEACDAFVALGCRGQPTHDPGTCTPPQRDLGTIPENDGAGGAYDNSMSFMTVATMVPQSMPMSRASAAVTFNHPSPVTPPFGPTPTPPIPTTLAKSPMPTTGRPIQQYTLAPLIPSPPVTGAYFLPSPGMPEPPVLSLNAPRTELQLQMMGTTPSTAHASRRNDSASLQNSLGENSFVMVEHGSSLYNNTTPSATALVSTSEAHSPDSRSHLPDPQQQQIQQQSSYFFGRSPVLSGRGDYMVVKQQQQQQPRHQGMLSTSPGTGGALMGMLLGGRARLMQSGSGKKKVETRVDESSRLLAAAEDVGRRGISVAHLGDNRAYLAMKLIMVNDSGSSLLSVSPMDGIEDRRAADHDSGAVSDDSSSTEIMTRRRRSSSATDKSMPDARADEADEMPFALQAEAPPVMETVIPTRSSVYKGTGSSISISGARQQQTVKPTPASIRSYFTDALSCYLKTLKMLKGALGAVENVAREVEELEKLVLTAEQRNHVQKLKIRCGVTSGWLSGQFHGVLERADAANLEVGKLQAVTAAEQQQTPAAVSVEELIYNHALGHGRDGAVKQLLGQFEAARSCYRSAGLLAETLLMEPRIDDDDRKTLEGFVDGFAARITELDETMLQQSRLSSTASSAATASRRGPSVVGLVGQPLDGARPGLFTQTNVREQYP